jgi:hypothetical protein
MLMRNYRLTECCPSPGCEKLVPTHAHTEIVMLKLRMRRGWPIEERRADRVTADDLPVARGDRVVCTVLDG